MCQTLEVSRSGFHDWRNRGPSKREQDDAIFLQMIKDVHQQSRGLYGLDKIHDRIRVYRLKVKWNQF